MNEDWIERHRMMRRAVLLWSLYIITLTIHHYLPRIGQVQNPDSVIIVGVIGILSVVIGFYKE
jgi:hypothetical protein